HLHRRMLTSRQQELEGWLLAIGGVVERKRWQVLAVSIVDEERTAVGYTIEADPRERTVQIPVRWLELNEGVARCVGNATNHSGTRDRRSVADASLAVGRPDERDRERIVCEIG